MPPNSAASPPPAAPPVDGRARLPRGRRYAVRALLVLGTIVGIVALLTVFLNRQALNADNWANTSSSLLANKEIRDRVSVFVVDQAYTKLDIEDQLASALPERLKGIAAPTSDALRQFAEQAMSEVLAQPLAQKAWKQANKQAMTQMVAIVEGKQGEIASANGGAVVLHLGALVRQAATRLGISPDVIAKIPPDAGTVTVVKSDDLADVQSYVKALRGLAIVLPVLAFLLFALAVWLARGRRRRTLMFVGFDLIVIGAFVLIARSVGGDQLVDVLATNDAVKPAVDAAFTIGTDLLRTMAQATLLTGIPVVLAAWLGGPTRSARRARGALAPLLRDQLAACYAVVGVLVALLIWWAPVPWLQKPIPVIIMIALVIAGVELLRRQTREETAPPAAPAPG